MKNFIILFFFFMLSLNAQTGRLIPNPIRNIPKWVRNEFSSQQLDRKYAIIYQLYPYVLRGDFNGDGRRDAAIQIQDRSSGKTGIAIFHARKAQALFSPVVILGASTPMSNLSNNFEWVNIWNLQKRGKLSTEEWGKSLPILNGDAIYLAKRDSISGLILWNGKNYSWHQKKE